METIKDLKKKLKESRPEEWDVIPDIDLYMDQVISYMTRQHIGLEMDGDEENLTSAMICVIGAGIDTERIKELFDLKQEMK